MDSVTKEWLYGFAAALASAQRSGMPKYVTIAVMEELEVTVSMMREAHVPPHDLVPIREAFPSLMNGGRH